MAESFHDLELVAHDTQRETARRARQNLMLAAMSGKGVDMADVARVRGLVMRERENSIFSDAWIPLAFLFVIIGLVAGRNPGLIALGITLLIIVGISTIWKNLSLFGVSYERHFDRTRVFPGEAIHMNVVVQNDKRLPLTWLRFRDQLPVPPDIANSPLSMSGELTGNFVLQSVFSMQSQERVGREAVLRFPVRGYYHIGPVSYESGDIFTLFTREREHKYIDTLIVYPQIWPLEELGLPAKEPFGEVKVRHSLFTDPIRTRGIRDYMPQDRFRDVHWKATARRGHLQTKVYDPSTGMTLAVFLNVATFARHWMGFDPDLLERTISVAASICNYGIQQGWGVGLFANGAVPNSDQPIRVQPGRSPTQLGNVLEALAAVTEFATGAIDMMLMRESTHLSWVSTIVLVTAVVSEEILIALVRLQEAGRRVVLLALGDEPPPQLHVGGRYNSILIYHIPSNVPAFRAGHRSATATEAALSSIPTPEPVQLEVETVE
ncbi:MAG: DUF58 domain-containing protein [Anaerolineales bacterium]|uniref:DUF58 domain-containing protein n=1 Tax=Promineifilum sp. TaxID=2664178 RepID=UPI001D9752B4|nr:DUF58 domain-containing protein [Anaerolineales bacterium]MCB8936464.1 DUF58 domain-containing protein [Promineifilum sp.]MCO5178595.1 DUF58 domain-containing protein [Promineifilum sp.]